MVRRQSLPSCAALRPSGGVRPRGHRNGSCQVLPPVLLSIGHGGFRRTWTASDPAAAQRQDDRANKQSSPTIASLGLGSQASKWVRCSATCRRRSSASSTRSSPSRADAPGVGCYWLHRTSSPSNVSSTSILPTSGSGSACTKRLIESSSAFRGCVVISTPRSPRSSTRPNWIRRSWPRCCGTPSAGHGGVMQNQEVSIIDLVQTPAQRETVDRQRQ